MDSLFYLEQRYGLPCTYRGYYIQRGDKLTTPENTGESCNRLAEELRLFGYKCRVGYNPEANMWSVAVL